MQLIPWNQEHQAINDTILFLNYFPTTTLMLSSKEKASNLPHPPV